MHAYNRMEADQTDSIAVCATKEEWREVMTNLVDGDWTDGGTELFRALRAMGVDDF